MPDQVIPTQDAAGAAASLQQAAQQAQSPADKMNQGRSIDPSGTVDMNDPMVKELLSREHQAKGVVPGQQQPPPETSPKPVGEPPSATKPPQQPWKRAADWKAVKTKEEQEKAKFQQQYSQELEQLRAQLKDAVKGEDHKRALEELNAAKERLRLLDITQDPAFQQKFGTRTESLIRQAKIAAGKEGKELSDLLAMPPSAFREQQIEALIEDMAPHQKNTIASVRSLLGQLEIERQMEMDAAKATWESRVQQEKQQAQLAVQQRGAAFNQVRQQWIQEGFEVIKETGDPEHDAIAKQLSNQAESYYSGLSDGKFNDQERSSIALWAAFGPKVVQEYANLQEAYEGLQKQLSKYQRSTPGTDSASDLAAEDQASQPRTVEELRGHIEKQLQQAQANNWASVRQAGGSLGW